MPDIGLVRSVIHEVFESHRIKALRAIILQHHNRIVAGWIEPSELDTIRRAPDIGDGGVGREIWRTVRDKLSRRIIAGIAHPSVDTIIDRYCVTRSNNVCDLVLRKVRGHTRAPPSPIDRPCSSLRIERI